MTAPDDPATPEARGSAAAVVDAFIAAIERKDLEAACALAHPEISYENVPMRPITGRDGLRSALESFLAAAGEVEWVVLRQVESGDTVLNERLDRFQMGTRDGAPGWLEMPVAGVFVVDPDGLITLWRDYFDLATYTDQLAELGVR